MLDVSKTGIVHCINSKMNSINTEIICRGMPISDDKDWRLKRSKTDDEKEAHPDFVFVNDSDSTIVACTDIIETAIRAGCLEDRAEGNKDYRLVPP